VLKAVQPYTLEVKSENLHKNTKNKVLVGCYSRLAQGFALEVLLLHFLFSQILFQVFWFVRLPCKNVLEVFKNSVRQAKLIKICTLSLEPKGNLKIDLKYLDKNSFQ
jgi:hypothetical protein